jgi:hypothetical protein
MTAEAAAVKVTAAAVAVAVVKVTAAAAVAAVAVAVKVITAAAVAAAMPAVHPAEVHPAEVLQEAKIQMKETTPAHPVVAPQPTPEQEARLMPVLELELMPELVQAPLLERPLELVRRRC